MNVRVSEVLDLHRNTIAKAKSEETRMFGELLLPLINRDKMKNKQILLNAYFKTITDNPDSTKSGTIHLYYVSLIFY